MGIEVSKWPNELSQAGASVRAHVERLAVLDAILQSDAEQESANRNASATSQGSHSRLSRARDSEWPRIKDFRGESDTNVHASELEQDEAMASLKFWSAYFND